MKKLIAKVRWKLAQWWDLFHSNSCWATTALWGLGWPDNELSTDAPMCRRESEDPESCFTCWCGKFKNQQKQEEQWRERVAKR